MDSDLSHSAITRFETVEADVKKLLDHLDLTSTAEDNAKAAAEAEAAAAPPAPVDPRDAEIEALKAQLAAKEEPSDSGPVM